MLVVGGLSLALASAPVLVHAQTAEAQIPAEQQVNINAADAETLADVLVGVGAAKAKAIVKFREDHGPFTSVEQLKEVNGIGEMTISLNKDRIKLD
ncbi:MAG: ComEA family DNA-binding protein [Pseudomonadota bacterium]